MGKKKKLFTCCVFAVLVLVIGAALYKMDSIYNKLSSLRDYVQTSMESKEMHKEKVSLEGYEVLEDEKDAWYTKYHFIAHAGGV